jgi:predicted transcriptional regulator
MRTGTQEALLSTSCPSESARRATLLKTPPTFAHSRIRSIGSHPSRRIFRRRGRQRIGDERCLLALELVHGSDTCPGKTLRQLEKLYYRSGIMGSNEKTISFRAVTEKIDALDSLAAAQDRSRSYLINEAIANYIELHAYQDALVRKGLEEKRKGRVLSHEEVVKGLKRTGRARTSPPAARPKSSPRSPCAANSSVPERATTSI